MHDAPPSSSAEAAKSNKTLWIAITAIAAIIIVLLAGKFGGFFDPEVLGKQLGEDIKIFADGPFGIPAIIAVFCVGAYLAVPQFILIGIAIAAFGAGLGAPYAWFATMCSGSLTYWVGRLSGQAVLARVSSKRLNRFSGFVSRNAFLASAIVRNVTAGPFVFVNTIFGALRVNFLAYLAGMGLGIIPKIALFAFAGKGMRAVLEGNLVLAGLMVVAALAVLIGGWLYVRYRRRKGENIALSDDQAVDTAPIE